MAEQLTNSAAPLLRTELVAVHKADYSWFFTFSQDVSVASEDLWRLVSPDGIVATSEDEGQVFGRVEAFDAEQTLREKAVGRLVLNAVVEPHTGDLELDLGGGLRLQFLETSSGYESWRLTWPGGETICGGGGRVTQTGPGLPQAGKHSV